MGNDMLRNKGARRLLAAFLIVLGGVLIFLAPEIWAGLLVMAVGSPSRRQASPSNVKPDSRPRQVSRASRRVAGLFRIARPERSSQSPWK
jgi:hypothetical protein